MQHAFRHFRDEIKLLEIYCVPRNRGIGLETRLAFLAELIHWRVNILQFSANGILNNFRPGFIGFAESHRIRMARPAIAAKRFVGFFSDVWPAHYNGHADGANRISHAISLRDHAGHRANTHQPDILLCT